MAKIEHEIVFLRLEIKELCEVNEWLSKRRRTKKTKLKGKEILTLKDITD